jgi:hypothetical protein
VLYCQLFAIVAWHAQPVLLILFNSSLTQLNLVWGAATHPSDKQGGNQLVAHAVHVWISTYLLCKNAPVQDIFTEVNDRHFWLSWCDPGDPALDQRWKLMVSFHPNNRKLPGYIGFSIYMVSVPVCPVTLTSVGTNLPMTQTMTQTSPKDARNRSAAPAGCYETCFNKCECKRDWEARILAGYRVRVKY